MGKKVTIDIQALREQGIITDAQYDDILLASKSSDDKKDQESSDTSHRSFQTIVSVFGGLMVSAGILLRVSLNRDAIADMRKTILLLTSMVAVYGWAWYRSRLHNDGLAAALWVIAVALLGANIFLQAQIYHLGGQLYSAFGWRFVGTIPLAYLTKMRTLFVTSLILFVVWYVSILGHYDMYERSGGLWGVLATIATVGFAFVSYSMIHRDSRGTGFGVIAQRIGQVALILSIPFLFVQSLYDYSRYDNREYIDQGYRLLLLVLPAISVIGLVLSNLTHSLRLSRFWSAGAGIHTAVLLILFLFPGIVSESLYPICLVYGLGATGYILRKGTVVQDKRLTSLGGFVLRCFIWIMYINHFTDFGAIGLIIGGILMIAVGYGVARMQKIPPSINQ